MAVPAAVRHAQLTRSNQYLTNSVPAVIPALLLTPYPLHYELLQLIQGEAERTPRFGRGIASDVEGVQWWGARRRTALYVPFSVYSMAWSGELRTFIVEEFIKHGVSPVATQRGDTGWPPRSPDLTPCDFFIWGYLKAKVYEQRPQTLAALRRRYDWKLLPLHLK